MTIFFQFDFWLVVLGSLFIIRQISVIASAEQGRKKDLVRKRPQETDATEFHMSVLIPYLDPNQLTSLLELLSAIDMQDYPASRVDVHLVTNRDTQPDLKPEFLKPNVKVWKHPNLNPSNSEATTWLIDRCLAAGGSSLFVFLQPNDIVKPDFFQNIASQGFEHAVMQGYVALKSYPDAVLSKVIALSKRLINRIGNAGRYHLGLSCRLMDSAWVAKQEVLEMIPYHRGADIDNLEYTIRLNLEGFKVSWAPNVVVYRDEDTGILDHATLCLSSAINRLRMFVAYTPKLLVRSIARFDLGFVEHMASMVKPPNFIVGAFLALVTLSKVLNPASIPGNASTWLIIMGSFFSVQLISLFVARARQNDYITMFLWTPIVYGLCTFSLPMSAFHLVSQWMNKRNVSGSARRKASYRHLESTRFNEDMESNGSNFFEDDETSRRVIEVLENNVPVEFQEEESSNRNSMSKLLGLNKKTNSSASHHRQQAKQHASVPNQATQHASNVPSSTPQSQRPLSNMMTPQAAQPQPVNEPREIVKAVPLSNGKKQVKCRLVTQIDFDAQGNETYQLTLEYKTVSFSTNTYQIMDQAYYELQSKLMARGLTIVSCGSCGQFYNPTADVPGALKNAGVCLFGKTGKNVNLKTDAVTVLSQACQYHCDINRREDVVRQWKESIGSAPVAH